MTQNAYFYVLTPGKNDTDTIDPDFFEYAGRGTITGAPSPSGSYNGAKIPIEEEPGWSYELPERVNDITYEGKAYTYIGDDTFSSDEDQFRVVWYRYSSAFGANSSGENVDMCWHIDGYAVFSDQYTINYKVQQPDSEEFADYTDDDGKPYVQYITKDGSPTVAQVEEPDIEEEKEKNDISYVFDGWYTNADCTDKAEESDVLADLDDDDNEITFYGKYVPAGKVYVYADAGRLSENSRTYLTEVLGITLDHNSYFPLGILSNAELGAAKNNVYATDDEEKNVKDAAAEPENFDCDDTYYVCEREGAYPTPIEYRDTTQEIIRNWVADYADGTLDGVLKGVRDNKEFGLPIQDTWHLDITLKDDGILPTVTVTPADITIYTGGDGYGGVTNGNGQIIGDPVESGLPEPGYHIELPEVVQKWLSDNEIDSGSDLSGKLEFVYSQGQDMRDWTLKHAGQYSKNRNVYTLRSVDDAGPEVRLMFFVDANDNDEYDTGDTVIDDDRISMGPEAVNATYTMTINPGSLDRNAVQAKFAVNDATVFCNVAVEPGTLTIKSVTNPEQPETNEIISAEAAATPDEFTAAEGAGVTYYVNDSEVKVVNTRNRVQLLVDEVSDNEGFNTAIGNNATDKVEEEYQINVTGSDTVYLDLVDTENGNTVVTMGEGNTLTIYWPLPEDAKTATDFHVVHYTEMDRSNVTAEDDLAGHKTEILPAKKTTDGQHITFETDSFSPFVLVWGTQPEPAPETYRVTFEEGSHGTLDGTTVYEVPNGESLNENGCTVPSVDSDRDYDFIGWTDQNGTWYSSSEIWNLPITGDMTFTAQYDKDDDDKDDNEDESDEYILHYESNGGTEYDDETYEEDTVVDLDKEPTRDGYTFTGWYADEELTDRITEIKMTSDKTVYAGWERNDGGGVPAWLNGDDHFAYVIGYPDGLIRPQDNISRAEVATIFFRLLKPEVREAYLSQTSPFDDLRAGAWYTVPVSTMAALDIIQGRTADAFAPDAPITRAEFAAICARFESDSGAGDSNFSDISGHWAEAEIERAASFGWVSGYPDGTFAPDNAITRAEAMTMINRVLQRLPEDEDDLLPDMNVWPDNQPGAWYYLAVQEAANSHDYTRKADGVHEHWTDMNADPDWTRYQ